MAGTKDYDIPAFVRFASMGTEKKSTGSTSPVPSSNDDDIPAFSRFVSMSYGSPSASLKPSAVDQARTRRELRAETKRTRLGRLTEEKEEEENKIVPEIQPYITTRQQERVIAGLPEEEPAYVSPYASNPDYAEMSKYISTEKKDEDKTKLTLWERLTGDPELKELRTRYNYEDPEYEYINRNEEAVNNRNEWAAANKMTVTGADRSWLQEMSDEQIADYNYIYHTQGKEAAEKFISELEPSLTESQMGKFKDYTAEYAREHPTLSSVASVLMGPSNVVSLMGQVMDYADDGEIDPNAAYNRFTTGQKTIRETVPENWSKVGKWLYGSGMSIADNLYNMALAGAFGDLAGLGKGAEAFVLGIMGSSAAANSTLEALENGYGSTRALLQGAIAGGIEALTEKISFETLLNPNAFADGFGKYVMKNMLAEGSEEGMSTLLNWVVDIFGDQITGKRLNEWARTYDRIALENPELTEDEIKQKMILTMTDQLMQDVAGGMLSGGLMAGGSSAINMASNTMMGRNINQRMNSDALESYVYDSYEQNAQDELATNYQNKINEKAVEQLKNTGKVKNSTLGALAQTNEYRDASIAQSDALMESALQRANEGREIRGRMLDDLMRDQRAQTYMRDFGGNLQDLKGKSYAEKAASINDAVNSMLRAYDEGTAEQRRANRMASERARLVNDFADTFGEEGAKTLKAMAAETGYQNAADLAKSYAQVYNAVMDDPETDLNDLSAKTENVLKPREMETVFKAALQDRETELRKTGLEYKTETQTEGENNGQTEEGSQDLGRSEERNAGMAEYVSVRRLAKRTGEIGERRDAARLRRESLQNNAAVRSIAEVTAKEAAIPNGLDTEEAKTIRVLPKEKWSVLPQDTYSFFNSLEEEGYTVKAWTGKAMVEDTMSGSVAAVRGFIDGKTIGVRVDAELSPREIVFHELFHDQVATGSEVQQEIVNKIYDHYGEARLRATIRDYVAQYAWTNATDDQILNEVFADAYAGIDIYEDLVSYEGATQYTDIVRSAVGAGKFAPAGNGSGNYLYDTTSIKFDETQHTNEEKTVFNEYLNSVDEEMIDFVNNRTESGRTSRHDFGKISETQKAQLLDLTNIDFSGYDNSINNSTMNHIEKRHGVNGEQDSTMAKPEDIARIGYVISNADYAEYVANEKGEIVKASGLMDRNNNPSPLIRFVKKVDRHYVAVVAAAEISRKKIRVVTAFMAKTKEAITGVSNADLSTLNLTAETAHPSLASANTISQEQASGQADPETNYSSDESPLFSREGNKDNNTTTIKEQLKKNLFDILKSGTICSVNYVVPKNASVKTYIDHALSVGKKWGYKFERQGFGDVVFDEKRIRKAFDYKLSDAEIAAFEAIPYVVRSGLQLDGHDNHKGRGYQTATFAARVEINGDPYVLGVTVKQTGKNYYNVHRAMLLTEEQAAYIGKEAEPTPGGGDSAESFDTPISSASENRIAESSGNVNTQFSRDTEGEENTVIDLSDDNVLLDSVKGMHGSEKYARIAEYIYNELGNEDIQLSDGEIAMVDKRDTAHIARKAGDKKTAESGKIRQIVERAQYVAYEDSADNDKFSRFKYYKAAVRLGEDEFSVYVNAGSGKNDGRWHIYDLTHKLRDTAHRVNDVGRPVGNTMQAASLDSKSLSQEAETVKRESLFSRDSEGNDLTEEQQKYFSESKIRDEDGNLMVVYHGTDADFTVFDRTKGRSTMDIQGSFFSPWDIDAAGYGPNVKAYYLNITNPAPESVAYAALNRFKGQNNAGVKAREYLESGGYDGVNNSDEEYIAFYPEQIKEISNTSPTSDPDIRYSRDTSETETEKYLKAQNRELQHQLEDITKRYEHFKDQLTLTKVRTGTKKSAYRIAKNILADYGSGTGISDLRDGLLKASEALFNASEDISVDELQVNMKEILMPYAADVINRSYGLMNEEEVKTQREIRSFLRNGSGIVVTDHMKSDIPDWAQFRKAQFGNMKLTSGPKTNVHEVYADLREQFGANYFPEDVVNESDMLQHIADVMADLSAIWDNPYTYGGKDAAEAVEACANDMMMELVNDIEEAPPTFADKKKAELDQARKEAIEAKDAALSRVREQRDEALKKQAEHYQDRIKSMYDKRKMYELRSQIRKKVNDMSAKLVRPTDKQHIPQPLQAAVIDVLKQVNTGSAFDWSRPYDGTRTAQGQGIPTKKTNAFLRLKDQLTELRDRLVIDQDLFDSEEGSGILSELALFPETSIDQLDIEQLQKVMIVLRSCENAVNTWNKMFNESKYREISEAAEAVYLDNADKKGRPEYARPIEMTKNLVSVDMLTPEAYFNRLGNSGKSLFKMLRSAQDQNINILKEAQNFSKENGLYDLKLKDYEKKLLTVKFGNRDVKMTKAQLMELYILNKRDASRAHIQVGGILPEPVNEGISLKRVTYNEPIRNVTQDDIAKAMSNLTPEDIEIADAMQKFVSTVMTNYGNEASMRVYGYEKFGEENYWPIKVNEQDLKTELGVVRVRARTVSNKGFTNAVKPNAKQSVMIGSIFDTFNEHVAEMANYSAWLPVMEDMKRIYNYTEKDREGAIEVSTKYTIQNVFGQKGTKYFEKLMQDLSNGTVSEQSYFGGLMGKFKAAAVGSNLRVIVQQPTAIFRAMDMISPKYLAEGMLKFRQGAKKAVEKAPIAQWKDWGYFDINTGRSTKNILFENSTTLDRVQNVLMSGAGKADSVAWGALYSAVEAETKAQHPDLDVRSKAFDEIVVERFEDIIDHSQVVDGVLQRSALMRSENAIDKMATSFMGEPTKQFNMLSSAIYDYKYAKASKSSALKYVGRTAAAMLFAGVLNAAVQSIMDAVRNDDPEKKYWEKFLEKFTGEEDTFAFFFSSNLGDLVNPLQYIPYAKDIVSIAQGYDVERMDVSLVNDLYTDGKSLVNALNGKGKYSLVNNIMNFTNTVAKFFGLSTGNVKRDTMGLLNTFAQNTGNYMMMYRMAKFTYNMNQSTNKGRFVDILAEAYENDREAYDLIMKDLVKEDKFATTTMTTYEWIRKRLKEKHQIGIPKE